MVGALPRALGLVKDVSCDCMFWDERRGGLAPAGPRVDTATIRTVLSTNRVDSGSFSSGCCAFRRTHTSESFNDWGGGGGGCHNIVPVLKGNGPKTALPGDIFDQTSGEMS